MGSGIERSEVTIVGGGLVGSLLAILLARRGHAVTVHERRSDLRKGEVEAGRSINLAVTRRGIRALERVGLAERALALTVPVHGRMVHGPTGGVAFQPYGRDTSECNYSISRAALNEFLVREAEARGARLRFDSRLVEADFERGRLVFENPRDGRREETRARVVFGADGAGSAARAALSRTPGFVERLEPLGHGYKELDIPAGPGGGFRIEKNALHVWPRGAFMLMALPNPDGNFTVTLYLPERGPHGFDRLDAPARVTALFREQFPDALPLIADLEAAFFDRPTGALGTVRCRPWRSGDRALLLGDAAHAIVPFFGQGMNCGFEDCTVLDDLIASQAGWGEVFAEFERLRQPNADAIADMAIENFVEMRDRVGDARFLLRKAVEHRLEVEMPSEYRSRYSMVMYSHIPYRTAQEAGEVQQTILDELCRELASAGDLDLGLARRLIRERLAPLLRQRAASLDY